MEKPMKVALSGYRGFIGGKLSVFLRGKGVEVVPLTRDDLAGDPARLAARINGCEAVVHLAGAPILGRWTARYRRMLFDSRVETTRSLVAAMALAENKPGVFLCASAVGIYPDGTTCTESCRQIAPGFLGSLCREWERAAAQAATFCRVLHGRFGIVLDWDGGVLKQLRLPFRLGLGGRIASGRQMMSWIHMQDLLEAMWFLIREEGLSGPVNCTSPQPVSNAEFTRCLAGILRRPAWLPLPAAALRLLFGAGATVLTGGQTALPDRLMKAGFRFRFPQLKDALTAA